LSIADLYLSQNNNISIVATITENKVFINGECSYFSSGISLLPFLIDKNQFLLRFMQKGSTVSDGDSIPLKTGELKILYKASKAM